MNTKRLAWSLTLLAVLGSLLSQIAPYFPHIPLL